MWTLPWPKGVSMPMGGHSDAHRPYRGLASMATSISMWPCPWRPWSWCWQHVDLRGHEHVMSMAMLLEGGWDLNACQHVLLCAPICVSQMLRISYPSNCEGKTGVEANSTQGDEMSSTDHREKLDQGHVSGAPTQDANKVGSRHNTLVSHQRSGQGRPPLDQLTMARVIC